MTFFLVIIKTPSATKTPPNIISVLVFIHIMYDDPEKYKKKCYNKIVYIMLEGCKIPFYFLQQ